MDYYNDIKFTAVGRQTSKFYHVDYRSEFYGIAFTRRGRMRFKKNNLPERELEAPFVYWYSPENSYTHGCFPGEGRDHSWCFCVGERVRRITSTLDRLMPGGCLQIANPIEMARLYDHMIQLHALNDPEAHFKLVVGFEQVVGLVLESYVARRRTHEPELYGKLRSIADAIKKTPFEEWDFHELARKRMFVSYSYLRQLFHRVMGMPPAEYLLRCRMEAAAAMLADEDVRVQEVADRCGYDNAAAFTRSFKKRLGLSPTSYILHLQR